MRKTIGIVGGAVKPFTNGHFFLVEKASKENNKVILFVSTADRIRKGEVPICFKYNMKEIWNRYLLPIMPENVDVRFVTNPTQETYSLLGSLEIDKNNHDAYVLYGDDQDLPDYYPDSKLEKHNPRLVQNNQVKKRPVTRAMNIDISGTKMRKYMELNDVGGFTSGLPKPVQRHGQKIFDILTKAPRDSHL